ncbi:hypothetical protein L218DRAFT_968146 [Marasmius fiardii PR-910]|nr:hypothetical protein L218DRAFT_968146 [Marasmius fiardii PR-910]
MFGTFAPFDSSQAIHAIQPSRYSELMSSTLIIFDHLITLGDEIELIWGSSWSPGKLLFLINRYYTFASVIVNNYAVFASSHSNSFCLRFFQWQGWTGLIACLISESILQMRLYALYSLNRKVLIMMVGTFLLTSATAAAIMGIVLSKLTAISMTLRPGLSVCVPLTISSEFYSFWIPILTFETVLCCLALFRGYQTFRTSGSPFQSGRKLVGMLIRDSVVYFLIMFAIYLINLLVFATRLYFIEAAIGWSIALSCVLGNRVMLNVRKEIEHPQPQVHRSPYDTRNSTHDTNHTSQSRSSKGWSMRGKGRKNELAIEVEYESETLTDLEMAQLRSMQEENSYRDPNGSFIH